VFDHSMSLVAPLKSSIKSMTPLAWMALCVLYWGVSDHVSHWDAERSLSTSSVAERVAVLAKLGAFWLLVMLAKDLRPRRHAPGLGWNQALAALMFALLTALGAATVIDLWFAEQSTQDLLRDVFFAALLAGMALVCVEWPVNGRLGPRKPRAGQLIVVNLFLTLLFAEVILEIWARVQPSVLFMDQLSAERRLASNRRPGSPYFGFRLNSGGYHDHEFIVARKEDTVVAVVSDSFGMGVVPFPHNFVTLLESRLAQALEHRSGRVAAHNFGVPSIGMAEYAHLVETEVLATDPELVVLAVFVGNDVYEVKGFLAEQDRFRYSFTQWHAYQVPRRLWRLARELTRSGGTGVFSIGRIETESSRSGIAPAGPSSVTIPAFVHDARLEKPTFSADRFLDIESYRVEVCHQGRRKTEDRYSAFFRALSHVDETLGGKLLVLLIPDEFQVNDSLWTEVLATKADPARYVRDLPQRRIGRFAREQGIALVDALPALRRAEVDGRTYHLRDTHLNARGNRILADVLAQAVLEQLGIAVDTASQGDRRRQPDRRHQPDRLSMSDEHPAHGFSDSYRNTALPCGPGGAAQSGC
jgi:hypothetical protein